LLFCADAVLPMATINATHANHFIDIILLT